MKTQILVLGLFFGAPNFVAAQDLFATGVLGTEWGSTVQQVKAKHPKGFAWHGESLRSEAVVYQVVGEFFVPGINTPAKMLEFHFTMQNQLRSVALRFDPADVDAALFEIANLLGQDYAIEDEAIERVFYWKPAKVSTVAFSLGLGDQYPWAHMYVTAHDIKRSTIR